MSGRQYRRPYARQRKENDQGEEEGFLYCLMYYFDEARRESEEGSDRRSRRNRICFEEQQEEEEKKKKDEDEQHEVLNPLVYREHYHGRSMRGGMSMHQRRAYTPDRDAAVGRQPTEPASASALRGRSHSQPPESHQIDYIPRRTRRKRK